MAKVVPYGCATAHGQLVRSIQFRRLSGDTILSKMTHPADVHTLKQHPVRDKLKDAVLRYQLLNHSEKVFLNKRSARVPGNPYSLWVSKYMMDQIWSRIKPIGITDVENMVIHDPVGIELDSFLIKLEAVITNLEEMGCIFWNKLGSDHEVENSKIGPDGILSGTMQYLNAKFDKGIHDWDYNRYIVFLDVHVFNEGILDHWYIPDFASDTPGSGLLQIMYISYVPSVEASGLYWIFSHSLANKVFFMSTKASGVRCQYAFTPLPFAAGEKLHLEWIINYSNPPGSRYRMFQNGTELSIDSIWSDNPLELPADDIHILEIWQPTGSRATMDNLKVYPVDTYPVQIAANREYENFSPDPISIGFYGEVEDHSNLFTSGESIEAAPAQRIVITNTGASDIKIPFRYSIAVTWAGPGIESRTNLIRLPEMIIGVGQTKYLYLSEDWSTYFDKELRDLACTNKM